MTHVTDEANEMYEKLRSELVRNPTRRLYDAGAQMRAHTSYNYDPLEIYDLEMAYFLGMLELEADLGSIHPLQEPLHLMEDEFSLRNYVRAMHYIGENVDIMELMRYHRDIYRHYTENAAVLTDFIYQQPRYLIEQKVLAA